MIQINFSEEDIRQLDYERFNHPHPRVQRKMEALWLKSKGLPHNTIAKFSGISSNTLTSYLKDYEEGGIEKLKEIKFYRPKSELTKFSETIESYFKEHPPSSIKEAMNAIEKLTGIRRSEPQIRKFLKYIGMSRRKVGMVPSKADLEKQEDFKKKELIPRLDEAKNNERVVYFTDAAHFVLSPFLGFVWCFARLFIKAPAGRKRFNVLGALNAITHELISVTNDSYINAQSVCDLLWKISQEKLGRPVTLVLDNARYQKCAIVKELSESLQIELLYLPPYSPNLNLIERLWKFVKRECLYSKYYDNFADFKSSISECLNNLHTTHKNDAKSLLTLNFQTFKESQFMT